MTYPAILKALPVLVLATVPGAAFAACNTARGAIDNQPEPPALETTIADRIESLTDVMAVPPGVLLPPATPEPPTSPVPQSAVIADARYDSQTLLIDLSKDIDSLIGFTGHYTTGVPILGIRFENTPGFDAKKHCNAIQPFVYKPRLERLPDGQIRASVENGRFEHIFDPKRASPAWLQDDEASQQFFWIFPRKYGRKSLTRPWELTKAYEAQYRKAPKASPKRRWTAEAYINLAMRQYRLTALNEGYPKGRKPRRAELTAAMQAVVGAPCDASNDSLFCLASHLIEMNEAPPPGDFISKDAFRVGDAGYQNSGVSTGVRQLDFGTSNDQAAKLVTGLLPTTVGRYKHGYGYRRPIRTWDIGTLNRWYASDGPAANEELSREEAKQLLIDSHATFLQEAVTIWNRRVDTAYPQWSAGERKAVALIAIDLENVSGYRLNLPVTATTFCEVMRDRKVTGQRSNTSVVDAQPRRVRNGANLLKSQPSTAMIDFSCVLPQPPAPVPPPPVQVIPTPAPVTAPVSPIVVTEAPVTITPPEPQLPQPSVSAPAPVASPPPVPAPRRPVFRHRDKN